MNFYCFLARGRCFVWHFPLERKAWQFTNPLSNSAWNYSCWESFPFWCYYRHKTQKPSFQHINLGFIHCADWLHFQTWFYTSVQNNSPQSYVCSVWAAYYTNCMCIAGVKFLILYWSHYILGHCKTIYLLWNAFTVVPIKMVIGASVLLNRDYESDLEYSSLKSG